MSVTLTENRTTYSFSRTLADYDLQHSGEEEEEKVPESPNPRPAPQGSGDNPTDWEDTFRRVPNHRPVDYDLDFAYRNTTTNNIERAFLWNMFNGIMIVSVVASIALRAGWNMLTMIYRLQTDFGERPEEKLMTLISAGKLEENIELTGK